MAKDQMTQANTNRATKLTQVQVTKRYSGMQKD
jgi:hypothetical protein